MALTDQTWTRPVMQSMKQGIVFYEYYWRIANTLVSNNILQYPQNPKHSIELVFLVERYC